MRVWTLTSTCHTVNAMAEHADTGSEHVEAATDEWDSQQVDFLGIRTHK